MSVVRGRIPARFVGGPMDGKVVRGVQARHFIAWDMAGGPVSIYTRYTVWEPYEFVPNPPEPKPVEFVYRFDAKETAAWHERRAGEALQHMHRIGL